MYTIENLKKKSNSYYEDDSFISFHMNNNITIYINKNNLNNIFRNQNDQIFSLSKDGGETWQMMLTNKPNLHLEEIQFIKQIEYELENIDYKINNIIHLYENIKKGG